MHAFAFCSCVCLFQVVLCKINTVLNDVKSVSASPTAHNSTTNSSGALIDKRARAQPKIHPHTLPPYNTTN